MQGGGGGTRTGDRIRVEGPGEEELRHLATRYGAPRIVREAHDASELSDGGLGRTRGAALVAALDGRGRVASVRKRGDPRWYLPSGRVREGESAEEAARREVREEASLEVELVSMPALLVVRYALADGALERWCPVFAARALGAALAPGDALEIEEAAWLSTPPDWWRGTWREGIMGWSRGL